MKIITDTTKKASTVNIVNHGIIGNTDTGYVTYPDILMVELMAVLKNNGA